MDEFYTVVLEGICFAKGDDLHVREDVGQDASLKESLQPLVGRQVKLSLHYWPPFSPDKTKWGYGSCLWEGAKECPAGHHIEPLRMLHVSEEGELRYDEKDWWVGGHRLPRELLPGHRIRLLSVALVDLTKLASDPAALLEGAERIREFLAKLRRVL